MPRLSGVGCLYMLTPGPPKLALRAMEHVTAPGLVSRPLQTLALKHEALCSNIVCRLWEAWRPGAPLLLISLIHLLRAEVVIPWVFQAPPAPGREQPHEALREGEKGDIFVMQTHCSNMPEGR